MRSSHAMNFLMGIYILVFFTYLFGPLIIMSFTAFNSAEFPAITPWECFSFRWFNEGKIAYDGQHLAGLLTDWRLHDGLISSLIIGAGVVCLSVPIGMAAAIVLTQVKSQLRDVYYSISIMPVLFPGVIIGISTVVLWDRIAGLGGGGFISDIGRNGIFLTILAQTCFISTYCFLIFVARLQRFDQTQEEAALDLGATQTQVFFKILIPYLAPAIASAAVIAFLASFENYNTTVFSILSDQTLTTVIASKVRLGISPALSALALTIIALTVIAAVTYEILRRRQEKKYAESQEDFVKEKAASSRVNKEYKAGFKIPKGIVALILLVIIGSYVATQIVKNDLYGSSCIEAADTLKKSKFLDQLQTLESNQLTDEDLQGGSLGGTQDYGDIFGDPTLFQDFGGFD
ncbi:MAG: ABC transporter permease [Candidatus Pelagibacterales bacterium]|jgi:spermidine/putrescine transport system permease protein